MKPSPAPQAGGRGISRVAMRLSALLVLALLGLAGVAVFAIGGIHEVGDRWGAYDLGAAAAARAGQAGKGFAVVANEVKNLATASPFSMTLRAAS